MNLPIHYAFEGSEVRALMLDGEPWFVAGDVSSALAYAEASKMTDRKSVV